jgi:hypothetical protein
VDVLSARKGKGSSTRLAQRQEGDIADLGGTAPGGVTAFVGGSSQQNKANALRTTQDSEPHMMPQDAALMLHHGWDVDEGPDGSGNVPINPGVMPATADRREGSDANPEAPGGRGVRVKNDATANDGRPIAPNGRHRGESPEIPKQSRGRYRA